MTGSGITVVLVDLNEISVVLVGEKVGIFVIGAWLGVGGSTGAFVGSGTG